MAIVHNHRSCCHDVIRKSYLCLSPDGSKHELEEFEKRRIRKERLKVDNCTTMRNITLDYNLHRYK